MYSAQNPVVTRAMAVMPPDDVACGSDFIELKAQQRTAFCNEWIRPQGCLPERGSLREARSDFGAMLFVARAPGQGRFGTPARVLLRSLVPHVRTALALARRLHAGQPAEHARHVLARRGWIAIGHDGRALPVEGLLVERLLAACALVLADGQVTWSHPCIQRACARCLAQVLDGVAPGPSVFGVSMPGLGVECEFAHAADARLVAVVGAVALLLVREEGDATVPPAARLAQHFGLTRQASIVAGLLVRGIDTRTIADRLGIACETVRAHVKHIHAKAGVLGRVAFAARATSLRAG